VIREVLCLPSIARRLARAMGLLVLVGLGLVSVAKYCVTAVRINMEQEQTLAEQSRILPEFVRLACGKGETELQRQLALFQPLTEGTRLQLWRADGSVLFHNNAPAFQHLRSAQFEVSVPQVAGGLVRGRIELDTSRDVRMLTGTAITLLATTLLGAAVSALVIRWLVRRELAPLQSLAAQTRAISPQRLDQRLVLTRPSEELMPWMAQFNALMDRLERAYTQLESFNADVAHELRTPLATLVGQTELALSRERSPEALRETLASNLEEMQRLSALVNDMLFLSQADRGAMARRGSPTSLAGLAAQVVEYHEATLEEAGLKVGIEGDAQVALDEPLVKRALSNLVGNATRFARPGSQVKIAISRTADDQVQVAVDNAGDPIAPQHLPRLFDRFFRVDPARCCEDAQHHGLGLAIVAAIARMHAGRTLAESADGRTRVGFTLATQA
jgi:two-component system heavy metal sensor histidine kinase CusS